MADPLEGLWTKRECAAFLNVGIRTLERLPVPRVKFPGRGAKRDLIRFDPAQVRQWLNGYRTRKLDRAS